MTTVRFGSVMVQLVHRAVRAVPVSSSGSSSGESVNFYEKGTVRGWFMFRFLTTVPMVLVPVSQGEPNTQSWLPFCVTFPPPFP